MHAVNRVDREAVEQPFLDHDARAAEPFLGGLEDQVHGAGEIRLGGEAARGTEQHGGMAVMAARVHLAVDHRAVRELVLLLQMQRVHVGAQRDRALARALALDGRDHAGLGEPALVRDAPRRQLGGDDVGGAHLLERGLGVLVDVATDLGELGVERPELADERAVHGPAAQ